MITDALSGARRALLLGLLLALPGCTKDPDGQDADGDGFSSTEDCDDADPRRHPGAPEDCNGEDEDCDGMVDEGVSAIWFLDQDGDGYGDPSVTVESCTPPDGYVATEGDCDDGDAGTNPEAPEVCGGADEDCDGQVDEAGAEGERVAFEDRDGDGFGSPTRVVQACEPGEGTVDNDLDCDDDRADIWPGAEEVWYDGVDQDCLGDDDYDADGDGFQGDQGGDCDDTDPLVHPGAVEVCDNGIDDDCDAAPGDCGVYGTHTAQTYADLVIEGNHDGSYNMGERLVWAGDWDRDGLQDLGISAPASGNNHQGRVHLFSGSLPNPSTGANAFATLVGVDWDGYLGTSLSLAGDLDGDGFAELLVGSQNHQQVRYEEVLWVVQGPVTGSHLIDEVAVPIHLSFNGSSYLNLSGGVDADGDTRPDFLVGTSNESDLRGGAWLVTAAPSQSVALADLAASHLLGESEGDEAGSAVLLADDLDGDGFGDLVVAARFSDRGGADSGAVYLVHPPVGAVVSLADADLIYPGEAAGDALGYAIAQTQDTDGDGRNELLLGARANDQADQDAGVVYVVDPTLETSLTGVVRRLLGSGYFDRAGEVVAGVGDIDGDGFADVAVGSPDAPAATGPGRAWLVYGPITGSVDLDSGAGAVLNGLDTLDDLGRAIAGAGDLDGDGYDDLALSARYANNSQGQRSMGQVYLFFGGSI